MKRWTMKGYSYVVVAALLAAGCSDPEQAPSGQGTEASESGAAVASRTARPSSLFRRRTGSIDRPEALGSRGSDSAGSRGDQEGAPTVVTLDPKDHVGVTLLAQPTLYALVTTSSEATVRLELEGRSLERSLAPGATLVSFALAEMGLELQVGRAYDWVVSVPFSSDGVSSAVVVAGGFIRRLSADEAPGADVSVETLLGEGVWYDALMRVVADTIRWEDAWGDMRRVAGVGG